jgi:hypothetical protein
MEATRGQSPATVLEQFLGLWRALLDYSQLRAGCAVVAVTVAGPGGELLDHVGTIFRNWTDHLAELFVIGGMPEDQAHRMATVAIAASEGGILLSRAQRSREPFDGVANSLLDLIGGSA